MDRPLLRARAWDATFAFVPRSLGRAATWCAVVLVVQGTPAAIADSPREPPSVAVLRVGAAIAIDGILDEEAWQRAPAAADFVQQDPAVGHPATERTEVRVLLDDAALYFGVRCFDSDPGGVIARELRRDNALAGDDRFEIVLDTFHDHRNAYHFIVNPRGTQYDALITDEGKDVNTEWDERWRAETRIDAQGWQAEVRIPLAALRSPEGADSFGVNFARYIRRKSELAMWTGWDRDFLFLQVSNAGHLLGVGPARTGLKLRLKPYVLGGFDVRGGEPADKRHNVGLEVAKFSLTPGLTAELTVNTDFAQTEVDQAIVNLTRFPAFFPEKREFFLERAGIFEFGLGGRRGGESERNLTMYYSRRIGLTDDRRQVPLRAGAKVIGRAAGLDLGLLNVQTGGLAGGPGSNYTVFRAKRNVLTRSNFGAFLSNRQTSGDDYNRVFGGDVNFTLGNTDLQGFLARSATAGRDGNSWAGRAKFNWYTDLYEVFVEHLYVGPEFEHDVGFVRRSDVQRSNGTFVWEPRPKATEKLVRYFVLRAEVVNTTDTSFRPLTREAFLRGTIRTQSDDSLRVQHLGVVDRLEAPFEISDGIVLPRGEYDYRESFVEVEGSQKRVLGGRLRYTFGDFYSGTRRGFEATPSFRPSAHFSVEAGYERNDVSLREGAFRTDLLNARVNVNLSNRLLTTALVQHDTESDRTVTYFRLNYIYRPGDDLFVVYSQAARPGAMPDRTLLVKATHSFDFR